MRFILLLAAVVLIAVSVRAASNEFELTVKPEPECDAGDKVDQKKTGSRTTIGNSKYRIIEAHIYWTDEYGKILGIAVCNVPGSQTCTTDQPSPKGAKKKYLALVVTLVKSSFEDQNIHYQYFDELFKLSQLKHPSSYDSKSQPLHTLNNFLFVSSATYKTSAETLTFRAKNCRENRAKSLISGHGYFITDFNGSGAWENLYYLPHRVGQYITTPN